MPPTRNSRGLRCLPPLDHTTAATKPKPTPKPKPEPKPEPTQHQVTEGPLLYGQQDLANFLQISVNTAVKLQREGHFPVYRRGRGFFYVKSEVIEGLKVEK